MTLGLGWEVLDENYYCITIDILAGTTSPENCMSLKKASWSNPRKKFDFNFYTWPKCPNKNCILCSILLPPDSSHHLLEDGGVDLEVEVVVLRHDLPADAPAQRLLYQEGHLLPCQVQYGCLLEYTNQ